jgi:hypothetical protein
MTVRGAREIMSMHHRRKTSCRPLVFCAAPRSNFKAPSRTVVGCRVSSTVIVGKKQTVKQSNSQTVKQQATKDVSFVAPRLTRISRELIPVGDH